MPWHKSTDAPGCDGIAVVKDDDGSVAGCHENEADADAQIAALYAEEPEADAAPAAGPPAEFHGPLAFEGEPTGDGRIFMPGSLRWREPPLPLMWQIESWEGHSGAVQVGVLDRLVKRGAVVWGYGTFDLASEEGREAARRLNEGYLRGNSVDIDADADVEVVMPEGDEEAIFGMPEEVRFHDAAIMGTTLVAFPAFAGAHLRSGPGDPDAEEEVDAPTVVMTASGEVGLLLGGTVVPATLVRMNGDRFTVDLVPAPLAPAGQSYEEFVGAPPFPPKDDDEEAAPPPGGEAPAEAPEEPEEDDVPSGAALVALPAEGSVDGLLDASADGPAHVTLAYLGQAGSLSDSDRESLLATLATVAGPAFDAAVQGRAVLGDEDARVLLVEADEFERLRAALLADDLVASFATGSGSHPHFIPHLTLGYGAPALDGLEAPASLPFDRLALLAANEVTDVALSAATLVASGLPHLLTPPADWYADPGLSAPTHLTVTDDGRVYGHLALWDSCHTSFGDRCIRAPRSATSYAYFRSGEVLCADGSRIATGAITLDTDHAHISLAASPAKAHYDHTGAAVADVACGEDAFGIWLAGAMRPTASPESVRALRAADVSGDWRGIPGIGSELVAVLAVNVPGFPVPHRPTLNARHKGDRLLSLVAGAALFTLDTEREAIAASIGRDPSTRRAELAALVHA